MDMRKFTKKGRAELAEERRMAEGLNKTIEALARQSAEESIRWQYCQNRDLWESDWWKRNVGLNKKIKAMLQTRFIEFGGEVFCMAIRGCGYDKSNYDLDDAVKERFPDQVKCDSESGGLFIDCTPKVSTVILDYLHQLDPQGDFGVTDTMEQRREMEAEGEDISILPDLVLGLPFGNWPSAINWLKERGIEVTVDLSDAPGPSEKQVATARDTLDTAFRLLHPDMGDDQIQSLVEYAVTEADALAEQLAIEADCK